MSPAIVHSAAPVPPSATISPQAWVDEINKAFGFSVGWVVKAGDLLTKAKQQLGHGQWSSLFEAGKLKFGLRTAEMLMAVARHVSLRNSKNFSSLPNGWSVLHTLSRLRAEVVEEGIANGRIHSEMKLADARQLVRTVQDNREPVQNKCVPSPFDPVRQRKRLIQYLRLEATRWPLERREELADLLKASAIEVLAESNEGRP